jgi:tape measure domain-containing protein
MEAMLAGAMAAISGLGFSQLYRSLYEAARFEQVTIGFETMIGDAEKARLKLHQLSEMAARTPFTLPGIEVGARTLLAMGFEADELIPTLKSLGDITAGLGGGNQLLFRMAHNLGQVRAQGKLTGREIRDFAIMGVPLLDELSKTIGVSKEELIKLTANSRITSDQVMEAFRNMSMEGGKFHDLMQKMNLSLWGQWSNLKDVIILTGRAIGQTLLPVSTSLVKIQIAVLNNLRNWVGEGNTLASSILVTTTALTGLTGAFYGAGVAARFFGISARMALVGTGIGVVVVALGIALGVLADKFKWFQVVGEWVEKAADQFHVIERAFRTFGILVNNFWQNTLPILKEAWKSVVKSIHDNFDWVYKFLKTALTDISSWFKEMFNAIGGYIDVMLGSWEGFGATVAMISTRMIVFFKSQWDEASTYFQTVLLKMKGHFVGLFHDLAKTFIENWIDKDKQEEALESLEKSRSKSKQKNDKAIEDLEKEHQDRMKGYGKQGEDALEKWKEETGDLPSFFDAIKEAWKAAGKAEAGPMPEDDEFPVKGGKGGSGTPLLEAGRFGFREFGKSIQDVFLKEDDVQSKILGVNEEQLGEMKNFRGDMDRLGERLESGLGLT